MKIFRFIPILIAMLIMNSSDACTTFCLQDDSGHIVFGRNFDFPSGLGHVVVNHRNLQKTAFIRPPEKPITWVSKLGSISFNQNGREFPYGGMNEAGLVIEQMWLQETKYPAHDHRYGLSELQWIQYQLDNAATVQEVIDSDTLLR
ncbi:MAG: linear amide C-N hydrolase, partial [Bacteroidales bacterium]